MKAPDSLLVWMALLIATIAGAFYGLYQQHPLISNEPRLTTGVSSTLTNYTFYNNWDGTDQAIDLGPGYIWYRHAPIGNGALLVSSWDAGNKNWTTTSPSGWTAVYTAVPVNVSNNKSIFMKYNVTRYPVVSYVPKTTQTVTFYYGASGFDAGNMFVYNHTNASTGSGNSIHFTTGNTSVIEKYSATIHAGDALSVFFLNGNWGWVYNLTVEVTVVSSNNTFSASLSNGIVAADAAFYCNQTTPNYNIIGPRGQTSSIGLINFTNLGDASDTLRVFLLNTTSTKFKYYVNNTLNPTLREIANSRNTTVVDDLAVGSSSMSWFWVNCSNELKPFFPRFRFTMLPLVD
jgi:hypothetical protein